MSSLLRENPRVPGNAFLEIILAALPMLEARWERARGGDPTALLDRAERRLGELVHRYPKEADAWYFLARVREERALWSARSGLDPTPHAREGLAALEHALDDSREPWFWVLRARLYSFAGDRARAKDSLERAWAINPLFKTGVESKETEAELSAAKTEREPGRGGGPGRAAPSGAATVEAGSGSAPTGAR